VDRSRSSLGEFEQAVLIALVRLRDKAYGVPIRKELSLRLSRDVSVGAVYTTLDRLEEKGLVKSRVGEPTVERGGRAKRYFEITGAGQIALDAARRIQQTLWRGLRPREVSP
jgi:PadR family transcriptional regulator, regulatory protein PadR